MPNLVGRTTKKSPQRTAALCRLLAGGMTRRGACAQICVDHATFYRWLERDATFRDAIQKAESTAELRFTTIVAEAAVDSWQAAAWWLERRRADDYARRQTFDVDIRTRAEQLAQDLGLDARDIIAEAERLANGYGRAADR